MEFQRGAANARKARMCEPCQKKRHTECEQEIAVREYREVWELNRDGFDMTYPIIPFCGCYRTTDIHV